VTALLRIGVVISAVGVGVLLVGGFPQAFGVVVEDGSKLIMLGSLLIAAGAGVETVARKRAKREEGTRNA
jgi:hypothetical protein